MAFERSVIPATPAARKAANDMSLWAEFVPCGSLRCSSVGPVRWADLPSAGQPSATLVRSLEEPEPMAQHQQLSRAPVAPARKAPRTGTVCSSAPQTRHPRSRVPTRSCKGAWRAHCGNTCLQPRLRRPGEAQSKVLGGSWGPNGLVLMGTGPPALVPNIWPSGLKQSHGFRLERASSHASSQARLSGADMSLWAELVPWGSLRCSSVGPLRCADLPSAGQPSATLVRC